jgi:hypothetical protein
MTASVLALSNLTWGKSFLPRDLSHGRVIMVLRRVFLVKRRWDGSSTQVHTIKCAWAHAVMSLCVRFLRPPLPEVLGLLMLIHLWEAPGCVPPGTRVPAMGQ